MKRTICFIFLVLAVCFAVAPCLAPAVELDPGVWRFAFSQVPGITPLDFPAASSPAAHWIWTLLASEIVAVVAGKIFLVIHDRIKNTRYAKAVTVIKSAVTVCYHEYVRVVKEASATGKLTVAQKNEALQIAYAKAIDFARNEGFDLLKVLAKETIISLIEKYVGEAKAPALVVGPLADLSY